MLTFPTKGNSTDPQVSAAQWTIPEAKSAVIIPHNADIKATLIRSKRICLKINAKFIIIRLIQVYTQMSSWARFPVEVSKSFKSWSI